MNIYIYICIHISHMYIYMSVPLSNIYRKRENIKFLPCMNNREKKSDTSLNGKTFTNRESNHYGEREVVVCVWEKENELLQSVHRKREREYLKCE